MATTQTAKYCPWKHAESLGIQIIYRELPSPMVAAYSPDTDIVYVRPKLRPTVEKCAIAHEIVHWEFKDSGCRGGENVRANKIAAQRLLSDSEVFSLMVDSNDYRAIARELGVTLKILQAFINN